MATEPRRPPLPMRTVARCIVRITRALCLIAILVPVAACGATPNGGGTQPPASSGQAIDMSGPIELDGVSEPFQPEYPVQVWSGTAGLVLGVGKASRHSSWLTLETVPASHIDYDLLNISANWDDGCFTIDTSIPLSDFVMEGVFYVTLIAGPESAYTLSRQEAVRNEDGTIIGVNDYSLALVNADARIGGQCAQGEIVWEYDMDLRRGWNWMRSHLPLFPTGHVITVDVATPPSDTPWVGTGSTLAR